MQTNAFVGFLGASSRIVSRDRDLPFGRILLCVQVRLIHQELLQVDVLTVVVDKFVNDSVWVYGRCYAAQGTSISIKAFFIIQLLMNALGDFNLQASSSISVGFFMFVVAWVFMIVIDFGFPYSTKYSKGAVAAFSVFPWSLLTKGIRDLAAAVDENNNGISWADRSSYCQAEIPSPAQQASLSFFLTDCVMSLQEIFWVLGWQCVLFMVLAVWFDNVLPDEHGSRKPLLFYLYPSYWFPKSVSRPL